MQRSLADFDILPPAAVQQLESNFGANRFNRIWSDWVFWVVGLWKENRRKRAKVRECSELGKNNAGQGGPRAKTPCEGRVITFDDRGLFACNFST